MRKYMLINLTTGECIEISDREFRQFIEGHEMKDVVKNRNFVTYKVEGYIVIDDQIAEYDE